MLQQAFLNILQPYTSQPEALSLWQELAQAYAGLERHYHNHTHLTYMLGELTAVRQSITHWEEAVLALCYHDAIYLPLAADNEEQSAAVAVHRLKGIGYPEASLRRIEQLILATKDHRQRDDADTNLFTDADLAILGAAPAAYDAYALAIRAEYAVVPEPAYRAGRRKVLQHFLNMPVIFKTPYFHTRYEAQATANLERELLGLLQMT